MATPPRPVRKASLRLPRRNNRTGSPITTERVVLGGVLALAVVVAGVAVSKLSHKAEDTSSTPAVAGLVSAPIANPPLNTTFRNLVGPGKTNNEALARAAGQALVTRINDRRTKDNLCPYDQSKPYTISVANTAQPGRPRTVLTGRCQKNWGDSDITLDVTVESKNGQPVAGYTTLTL